MPHMSDLKKALKLDRDGDWDGAHTIVQNIEHPDAYWVHAYLHRKEGDQWNAGYWYRRAGRSEPEYGLDQEWQELCEYIGSQ